MKSWLLLIPSEMIRTKTLLTLRTEVTSHAKRGLTPGRSDILSTRGRAELGKPLAKQPLTRV